MANTSATIINNKSVSLTKKFILDSLKGVDDARIAVLAGMFDCVKKTASATRNALVDVLANGEQAGFTVNIAVRPPRTPENPLPSPVFMMKMRTHDSTVIKVDCLPKPEPVAE
jgi:hypothetical protein